MLEQIKDFRVILEDYKVGSIQLLGRELKIGFTEKGIFSARFTQSDSVTLCDSFSKLSLSRDDKEAQEMFTLSQEEKIPILVDGTEFQIKVWNELLEIPFGQKLSYSDVAKSLGKPTATRAVANAIGKNKIAYLIPCHRVVRLNGDLGGYRWGRQIKKELLDFEKVQNMWSKKVSSGIRSGSFLDPQGHEIEGNHS